MRCKFIGADMSMGLKNGKKYNIEIIFPRQVKRALIFLEIKDEYGFVTQCPYSSLQAIATNWDLSREGQEVK